MVHLFLRFTNLLYQLLKLVRKNLMTQQKQKRFIGQNDLYLNPEVDNYGCFSLFSFNSCSSKNANACLSQQAQTNDYLSGRQTPINLDCKIKQSLKKKQNSPTKRVHRHQEKKMQENHQGELLRTYSQRQSFNLYSMRESQPNMSHQSQATLLRSSDHQIRLLKEKSFPNLTQYYRKSMPSNVIKKPVQPFIYFSPPSYIKPKQNLNFQKHQPLETEIDLHKISQIEQGQASKKLLHKPSIKQIQKSTHLTIQENEQSIESQQIIEEINILPAAKRAQKFNELKIRKVDSIRDQDSEIELSIVLSRSPKQSISDGQGQSVHYNISQSYFPKFSKNLLRSRH